MIVLSRGVSLFLLLMLVVMLHTELSISGDYSTIYVFIPFALVYSLPLLTNSVLLKFKAIIVMAFLVSVVQCAGIWLQFPVMRGAAIGYFLLITIPIFLTIY
ncbi:hypothetical protein [Vibrio parahaemolyticus]|uniref:hypothetical protein n=1 Tax=Vibrio TaxID=662 RepID=UPI001110084E|nr:hypothetical protein [Vibrio parahaemolyticus]MDF4877630.1 hypothetical protein [Vibrio parahaemolyticus]MDF5389520.1 hypothetical protein [Vibrio parahaemolyticus]MDF5395445.1 hypothetical protein [Vibrio parahaemolyticus]QRH15289.1 hypothetical protein JCT84_16270 [Vibrio parahaemolyticus]TMX37982.1 hypothetical protein DA098_15335 [Vibrio parahaemolyticus]